MKPLTYNPTDIYTVDDLNDITTSREVNSDIIIRGGNIRILEGVEKINGFLGLCDSEIESLGDLKEVKGNLFISSNSVYSNILSLNKLEFVGGDLVLRYSNLEDLGALKKVGGKLSLRDTPIKHLGALEFVGGDLFLPKRLENQIDLTNLTVGGKIRFWNDNKARVSITPKIEIGYAEYEKKVPFWRSKYVFSYREIGEVNEEQSRFYQVYKTYFLNGKHLDLKGNDNYSFILMYDLLENHISDIDELQSLLKRLAKWYPKTKRYGDSEIIKKFEKASDFESSWNLVSVQGYVSVEEILEYENRLNRELLNGELILKLGGFSHLTEFGKKNIDDIIPFATKQLEIYKSEKGVRFFDLFFENGMPIKTKTITPIDRKKTFLGFLKKQEFETVYRYKPEYYKDFFLSTAEFEHYKLIDDFQSNSGYGSLIPHVVEKAIFNQCKLIMKQAEDLYREEIGMPKVGEGWISETELYYRISNHFKDEEVIHHASPEWLGRQHLDIYLSRLNIGIEYQGAQHFEPIDFFGGHEAFEKTVERDKRKKVLCEQHNCHLIYAEKGYDIGNIIREIEKIKRVYDVG